MSDLTEIVISKTLKERNGSVITPATVDFFIDNIMVGNLTPIHDRVRRATGIGDFLGNAIEYFNEGYASLK